MEFKERMEQLKQACRPGDIAKIAARANVSEPTVRKTFRRESAFELTENDVAIINACEEILAPRFESARQIEEQAKRIMEG